MAKTFNLYGTYLDEGAYLDTGLHLDAEFADTCVISPSIEVSFRYVHRETLDIIISGFVDMEENYADYVDLLKLVPEKFVESEFLQEFLYCAGIEAGTWIGHINDIEKLIDKYSVGDDYIQFLADLVGLSIVADDTTLIAEKRRQLDYVTDWYKMKGTYKAIQYVAYQLGMNLNVWDLYTNDYTNFVREDWFAGGLLENPDGLNSSYYKSPHIEFETILNSVQGSDSASYLFDSSVITKLQQHIEKVRPVNVVPHYSMYLNPIAQTDGQLVISEGNIYGLAIGSWNATIRYLDESPVRHLDDGEYLDYTNTGLLNGLTKWKLGTGHKGQYPTSSLFSLSNVVLSGDVTTITISPTKAEYEFVLDSSVVQLGLSELGIYESDGTTLRIASTFPSIDKINGVSFRIKVTLNFS